MSRWWTLQPPNHQQPENPQAGSPNTIRLTENRQPLALNTRFQIGLNEIPLAFA